MLSGNYSTILSPRRLRFNGAIDQPGVKLGLGIKERVDIKFYYSRWAIRGSDLQRNVFQLIAKVTDEQHLLALYLPFGLIHSKYKHAYGEFEIGKVWMISPRMITVLIKKGKFELCIIPYIELLKEKSCRPFITGEMNLGAGCIALAEKLVLRLEGGVDFRTLAEGYPCGTAGIGVNYFFRIGKR
jgi:hypothetical protein